MDSAIHWIVNYIKTLLTFCIHRRKLGLLYVDKRQQDYLFDQIGNYVAF